MLIVGFHPNTSLAKVSVFKVILASPGLGGTYSYLGGLIILISSLRELFFPLPNSNSYPQASASPILHNASTISLHE